MDMEFIDLAKQLSPEKFEFLADRHGFDDTLRAYARRVLVDGEAVRTVADDAGMPEVSLRTKLRKLVGTLRESVRLTDKHFEMAAAQVPRMTDHNKGLVRQVLVNGESPKKVASEGGISPETLKKAVLKIRRLAIPDGWRTITVSLPEQVADGVEQMEVEAYKDHLENQKEK